MRNLRSSGKLNQTKDDKQKSTEKKTNKTPSKTNQQKPLQKVTEEKSKKTESKSKKQKHKKKENQLERFLQIEINQIYYVKLRGYAAWPCVAEEPIAPNLFRVHFFGDYTRAVVFKTKFVSNFIDGFKTHENVRKPPKTLQKAVAEAAMLYSSSKKAVMCPLCNFLNK